MKITLFTSNLPRHVALARSLSRVADELFVVHETTTLFPGQVADFYAKTPTMQDYFSRVIVAEQRVFGRVSFHPRDVRTLSMREGDLNLLPVDTFSEALDADVIVVFGASYIKGQLAERLIARGALNIHMGVSPYFRGSSCNFWAIHDGHADLVGATIHLLSRGLDSGDILFHALPAAGLYEPFELGMLAVKAAHEGLVAAIGSGEILTMSPQKQDKRKQIRYSRHSDFDDRVAAEYLAALPSPEEIGETVRKRDATCLVRAFLLAS